MFTFRRSLTALAVTASLGLAVPAMATDTNGFITGSATTTSGTVLSGTTVTIENIETGLKRSVTTGDNGVFRFPLLPPGAYKVTAEKDGYQTLVQEKVQVGISGKVNMDIELSSEDVETISVTGSMVSMVDVTSTSTGITVDAMVLEKVPVPRDFTGVALLAPGTTKGDSAFGDLPSIGGASVAENAFYVNGLNITNFRTGVGSSEPPFDMFETFEVKTGGYSAEFGRVTGGVINAKTKSGSNEFKFGMNAYWEPDSLRADKPTTYTADGLSRLDNRYDENDYWDVNIWASGAIIEDRLFYYALYNPRSDIFEYRGRETQSGADLLQEVYKDEDKDAFWAAKIDWYINDSNILEVTAFSDESKEENYVDFATNGQIDSSRQTLGFTENGGKNYTVKYTSILTDNFSVSAQWGLNKYNRSTTSALDVNPVVYRRLDSNAAFVIGGNWANFTFGTGEDEREVLRVDADWYLGDHEIRFGIDTETLTAVQTTVNSGNYYYLIYMDDVTDPANPSPYEVRRRTYASGGEFENKNTAFYIQDQWQVSDNLVLNLGVRNDSFENKNGAGDTFVKLDNNWGLRTGAVYDPTGTGDSKIWVNYGRYYLPVAANTNIRLSGAETYIQEYREWTGFADSTLEIPNFDGAQTRPDDVFSNGDVPSADAIVDANLDSMYSDEFIAGYQFQLNDEWSMGIQATYRELSTTIEDVAIDYGFNKYLEREFGSSCTECSGFHYYVLANPGADITVTTDPDGDGPLKEQAYTIPSSDLNYPESVRNFGQLDITAEKAWDGVWMMKAAYTWSHSWGNNEGYVRSDNGQDDAGLTTLFDQPGLLDGAYGNLPNDRRHAVKVFGSYQLTDDLQLGANFQWQSGRPKNAFGYHPTDEFARIYGSESFYSQGELVPRGSLGTTPSTWQLDLTASYQMDLGDFDLTLRADVFNVFNNDGVTEVFEIRDDEAAPTQGAYVKPGIDADFGNPSNWQTPRFVRLSANLRF
ncbi:TonB-dependent receptor [Bowmanella yangjiangensis]|uniref:TonB-dependent receptor n=1 Tax=Bowmanella yangjiangensis TaxID=2811230 RepID=A0ABS3CUU8_9ALTE|nr:TonB-dependent receptor [Bowmanella yangjiangensis]MBN7820888.1 TonB-dependent receptor [Bowmanella yangjiangensis]